MTVRIEDTANQARCVAPNGTERCRTVVTVHDPLPLCRAHYKSTGLKEYHEFLDKPPEELADLMNLRMFASWVDLTTEGGIDRDEFNRLLDQGRLRHEDALRNQAIAEQAAAQRERHGVVYFLRVGDMVKIGTTMNLKQRLSSYSLPDKYLLATEPGYLIREAELHKRFVEHRQHGEWYSLTGELAAYIQALPGSRL